MLVIDEAASVEQVARLFALMRGQDMSTFQERFQETFDAYAAAQTTGDCEEIAQTLTDAENEGDAIINDVSDDFVDSVIDYSMWVYGQEIAPAIADGRVTLSAAMTAVTDTITEKLDLFRQNILNGILDRIADVYVKPDPEVVAQAQLARLLPPVGMNADDIMEAMTNFWGAIDTQEEEYENPEQTPEQEQAEAELEGVA